MKIINPSATIIEDELAALSIYQRIDACASVCYQRPPKPTEEEAQEFCRKMLSVTHMSTLEMARISVMLPTRNADNFLDSKYIDCEPVSFGDCCVSGSVRAFMELEGYWMDMLKEGFLAYHHPIFFGNYVTGIGFSSVRLALPGEIPWQHKHVAARFIVNRAVSHELVRHRPISVLQESQRYCRYEDDVVFIEPLWAQRGDWLRSEWLKDMERDEERYKFRLLHKLSPQEAREKLPNSTKTELICYASLPQWKHMFDLRCSPAADPEMRRVMIPLREEFKEKYKEVEW